MAEFLPYVETFTLSSSLETVEGLADPSDAVFVHLARQAKVEWLVSGDAHLLALERKSMSVTIIPPVAFLEKIERGI